ncbi:methionine--tRNA ligase subunit beta [Candidatus Woesearchaeota archaeon]|nr:methionine--tRNA ligase subunit beta [Candidatus Woesearchaeota archaeon]
MEIEFEQWENMDLRVAEILDVEDHPNADKLYILKILIGEEERTIVAGIRKYYSKEELIGRKIIVFANLKPVVLRGVKSEGMLLAASDENKENVVLLTVEKDIESGAKIG